VAPGCFGGSSRPYDGAWAALLCAGDGGGCEGKPRHILELKGWSPGGAFVGENYGMLQKDS
jgi:hypothetical protein